MEMALGRVVSLKKVGGYGLKRVMQGGMLVGRVERGMRGELGELGLGGW
jgi:hypothetical protein